MVDRSCYSRALTESRLLVTAANCPEKFRFNGRFGDVAFCSIRCVPQIGEFQLLVREGKTALDGSKEDKVLNFRWLLDSLVVKLDPVVDGMIKLFDP